MRISDWSSDVCSSDLGGIVQRLAARLLECRTLLLDLGRVAKAVDHHLRALGRQRLRIGKPDPRRRAGNDGGFTLENHGLLLLDQKPFVPGRDPGLSKHGSRHHAPFDKLTKNEEHGPSGRTPRSGPPETSATPPPKIPENP